MARIRTIKPEFWTDSKIVGLSPLARLMFIGCWNFADDYGALPADPLQLKLRVLPAEQCDAQQLVDELLHAGVLVEMSNGDKTFWVVWSWEKHQKVDKRSNSQYGNPDSWSPAESRRTFAESRRTLALEGKGREGTKEGKDPSSTDVDHDDQFEQFWDSYPARNGKKLHKAKARQQWRTKVPADQRAAAITGARHYAQAYDDGISGVGAMDPFRWLRDEQWNDWQTPAQPDHPPARAGPKPLPSRDADYTAGWAGRVAN